MRFARFDVLYWLLGAWALLIVFQWRSRKHFLSHTIVLDPVIERIRPSVLRLLPRLFLHLGVIAAGITLMDPRISFREQTTRLQGVDFILVVDLSSSMKEFVGGQRASQIFFDRQHASGPRPDTRMQVVQRALLDFISKRRGDRLAMIAFSENTYLVSPLTTDHGYLEKYIPLVDPDTLLGEGMTAIGEGIAAGVKLFQTQPGSDAKSKVIVVFTDGENNIGREPVEVLREARRLGYRVYLIGVQLAREIIGKEKERDLIRAIEATGGQYFDATDVGKLELAYETIDRIEKGVFVERTLVTDSPIYQNFVYISLGFLFAGLAFNAVPYFIDIS